jgi:hypothetical protein
MRRMLKRLLRRLVIEIAVEDIQTNGRLRRVVLCHTDPDGRMTMDRYFADGEELRRTGRNAPHDAQ